MDNEVNEFCSPQRLQFQAVKKGFKSNIVEGRDIPLSNRESGTDKYIFKALVWPCFQLAHHHVMHIRTTTSTKESTKACLRFQEMGFVIPWQILHYFSNRKKLLLIWQAEFLSKTFYIWISIITLNTCPSSFWRPPLVVWMWRPSRLSCSSLSGHHPKSALNTESMLTITHTIQVSCMHGVALRIFY